jgi:hypothetical protein
MNMNDRDWYQHNIMEDMFLGAIYGDFAPEMGGAGRLTQIILGFTPFFGTICAIRDFFANVRQHDTVGAILNAVAAIPVFGGFVKVAKVLRAWRMLKRPTPLNLSHDQGIQERDPVWPLR